MNPRRRLASHIFFSIFVFNGTIHEKILSFIDRGYPPIFAIDVWRGLCNDSSASWPFKYLFLTQVKISFFMRAVLFPDRNCLFKSSAPTNYASLALIFKENNLFKNISKVLLKTIKNKAENIYYC